LATASGDSTAKLWDLSRNQIIASITDNTLAVWSVHFNDDGEMLATASLDQAARIFDVNT
jgi:WD40 repeat protein